MAARSLVWFRNDLRVSDHPALAAARARGEVVGVYCQCVEQWRQHGMADWRLSFQQRTLEALSQALRELGIPLLILQPGAFSGCAAALADLCQQHQLTHLDFIDEYPLNERRRDQQVVHVLGAQVEVSRHTADVVVQPGRLKTGEGRPYTVFTPFYRRWLQYRNEREPAAAVLPQAALPIPSTPIPRQLDGVPIDAGAQLWPAGEQAAQRALDDFVSARVAGYAERRDIPGVDGTSRLSAHLAVGAVSPAQCVRAAEQIAEGEGVETWVAEIAWRDFYRHIVAQFDRVSRGRAFRPPTDRLPWQDSSAPGWQAWCEGQTGYPLVDAGMRQLNQTGWMHNRLRMVTAMFLSKHLLIDWRLGEQYFMQRLVDGDFASNNGGWQWSAATGTDAAPYFRIFNPASQGQKFDPQGEFVTRWVPELKALPAKLLYKERRTWPAGIEYAAPVVEHGFARRRALDFFKANL